MSKELVYQKAANYLKQQIEAGEYKPGDQVPTEIKLAEILNVSVISTRRALGELEKEGYLTRMRGKGSFVTNRWMKRSVILPRAVSKTQGNIVMISDQGPGTLMYPVVNGAAKVMSAAGYRIYFIDSNFFGPEEDLVSQAIQDNIDGIMLLPKHSDYSLAAARMMKRAKVPFVLVDKNIRGIDADNVTSDNYNAGYLATEELLMEGHRRVAFVSPPLSISTGLEDRFRGYREAFSDYGVEISHDTLFIDYQFPDPMLIETQRFLEPHYRLLLLQKFKSMGKDIPTGIVCANGQIAYEMIELFRQLELNVPYDISLVSIDQMEGFDYLNYSMTCISQEGYEMGRQAASLLLRRLGTDKAAEEEKAESVRIGVRLVKGISHLMKGQIKGIEIASGEV